MEINIFEFVHDDLLYSKNENRCEEILEQNSKNLLREQFFNSLLCIACEKGIKRLVEILLKDPRSDPNTSNGYPIRKANKNRHHEIVEMLMKDRRFLKST